MTAVAVVRRQRTVPGRRAGPAGPRRPGSAPHRSGRTSTASCPGSTTPARVLYEARDPRNPLLDRVNFLTIFASMLDEFFQIRSSGLRQQLHAGSTKTSPDGRTAGEQLVAARKRVLELVAGPQRRLGGHPQGARRRGHRDRQVRRDPRAPRHAPPAVHRRDLPGPHAARGRPRPSVPVHLDAQPLDRGRAARPRDRRAALRPGQGPPDPAAALPGRAEPLRPPRPDHRGEPRPAVQRHGDRRAPPVPGHPQRRPRDRGGRGRRPAAGDRGGAPAAALRRGRPARGRAVDAGDDAGDPARAGSASARTTRTRSGACSTSPACATSSTSTGRT